MAKQKKKYDVLKIIRYGLLVILFIYIGMIFAAQGDSSTPFKKVEKAVTKAASDKEMKKADARELKRLYGLNEKELEDVSLYYTQATMGVNEILLVRAEKEQDFEMVEDAVKRRKETQIENFEGYGAKQVKLLDESIVKKKGRYLLYVVSPKAEKSGTGIQKEPVIQIEKEKENAI